MHALPWLAVVSMFACGPVQPTTDSAAKIALALKQLEPRPLSLKNDRWTIADFLTQLEKQTGNVVKDRRQAQTSQPMALDLNNLSFWQALDQASARAGCGYSPYSDDGVALIDRPRRAAPVSYHGIARVAIKRIAVAHDFEAAAPQCLVLLDIAWEPRFQPFYLGIGPASATFASGGDAKERKVEVPGRGQVPVVGRSASEFELPLAGPTRQAPALATLAGSLKLLGPSKMLTLRFPKVQADAALVQEEVAVRLNHVKTGLDRWLIEVQIDNPEGTPAFESFQSWLDNNRVQLVRTGAAQPQTWLPEPNETVHFESPRKAIVEYAFALPSQSQRLASDWSLVVRTPGRMVELVVPYEFKNVPLP